MHDRLVQLARDAATTECALVLLHEAGASPIDAIRALVHGRGFPLKEAKQALHTSPAWHVEARSAEAVWEEIDKMRKDVDDGGI